MIEVIKDIGVGLLVGVIALLCFLLTLWVIVNAPAWLVAASCGLGFAWCIGRIARSK